MYAHKQECTINSDCPYALVSYLICAVTFTLLRFYHSTAFILRILHYLSRRKPFDSYEPGLHPVNRFILSILSFRFLSNYYSRAFIASCTPTNYQLVRRIDSYFPFLSLTQSAAH